MTPPLVPLPRLELRTNAVITRLESTGLLVGDARKPEGAGWQGTAGQSAFVTYLVAYLLDHRRMGSNASIADRLSDPESRYQVNAVGKDRQSADRAADLAAAALLNRIPLDIPDTSTVLLIHELSTGAIPDESTNPPVFTAVDRYRLDTSTQ